MKVELIDCTKNGIDKIARMGRSTRLNDFPEKWDNSWGTQEKFVKSLMKIGHLGILEHVIFTFHVSGISRNLTHQLVRHRIASYLQQSNRRVQPKKLDYVTPPTIEEKSIALQKYKEMMNKIHDTYNALIHSELKIPVEDARYLLPSGFFTHIAITMNARQLLHFFELRCHKSAQWEIREMAKEMLEICKREYPAIFEGFKEGGKMKEKVTLWTVYKYPADYPDKYVARKFVLDKPTSEVMIGDTLEEVRNLLPKGLTRVERDESDDPVIVETWM